MPLNARNKGGRGEREIALSLNGAIGSVMKELGYPDSEILKGYTQVQRNPLQSAIGGKDLTGTFDLCFEVKRQEILLIDKWWDQTCASAQRENGIPILVFRQNNEKWRVRMLGDIKLPDGTCISCPVELTWLAFYEWFKSYLRIKLAR